MSEHTCHKCDQPNPWEFPQTLGYQRYEAALAIHRLLWAINDVYRIDRFFHWLARRLMRT